MADEPQAEDIETTEEIVDVSKLNPIQRQRLEKEAAKKRREALKRQYTQIADSPALADILKTSASFAEYHMRMATDGVGYVDEVDAAGAKTGKQKTVTLSNDERLKHLDRAAGINEMLDYIKRNLA